METRLLDEVKDILDELNILKNLALDQKTVYESWKSVSGMEDYHHITPSEVKEDIEGMIEDSKSVQSAINTLLDLKQKEATILEAQATRRQSDAVMVFTVVTIIFVSSHKFLANTYTYTPYYV
jgi:Mg2+ and Co2+ transporter CorA